MVCGSEYKSKTALQREWRDRCHRYTPPNSKCSRVFVSKVDATWFISAAHASSSHHKMPYREPFKPSESNSAMDLKQCLTCTDVFVDTAAASLKPGSAKHKSKHLKRQRCVFFGSKSDLTQFRSVSSNLGDTQASRHKFSINAWLRQAVQGQIDSYRRTRKLQSSLLSSTNHKPYNCDICQRTCRGKENHIDHGTGNQSFRSIVKLFECEKLGRSISVSDCALIRTSKSVFRDEWQKFHKKMAKLSLTCKVCNLTNK